MPNVIVVMGVSGSGKTTIGRRLAEQLHCSFKEGDEFHPAANIVRMRAGTPLNDDDRAPWLAAIEQWIDRRIDLEESAVISCSALKRSYRAQLSRNRSAVRLLFLRADEALLAERLRHRSGHFMPPALLHSQFETLEMPHDEPAVCVIDVDQLSIAQIVQHCLSCIEQNFAMALTQGPSTPIQQDKT